MAGAAGGTASATALPTDAAAPTATATTGTALPSLGALAPAAAAGAKPTSVTALSGDAQTAALMSMATKALDPSADDSASPAAPDAPAFVLPTTTAATLGRLQDPAPVFSASPTPTPEMGSDNFDDAIGARMSWLADQKIGHAHIKVTPNEMGPVEVRLHLDGDKVSASFTRPTPRCARRWNKACRGCAKCSARTASSWARPMWASNSRARPATATAVGAMATASPWTTARPSEFRRWCYASVDCWTPTPEVLRRIPRRD